MRQRLAEVTDEVRSRLKKLLDDRDVPHALGSLFPGESAVATQVQTLGPKSDVKALEKLAELTEKDHARIKELETEIARLKLEDIPKRTAQLRKDAGDLERLSSSLTLSERIFGQGAVSAIERLLSGLRTARREAEHSGAERFRVDAFTQVGTEVWREFLIAAKSLAEAEESDGSYPQTGRPCLLCRQPLSQEATALVRGLWEFLASDATARFEAAQQACVAKRREIEQGTLPYFGEDSGLRRTLNNVDPDLALAIEKEIDALRGRSGELVASLQHGELKALTALVPSDKSRLAAIAEALESEAASLQTADVQRKLHELENKLRDLEHRRTLSEQLPAAKAYVETQRWF